MATFYKSKILIGAAVVAVLFTLAIIFSVFTQLIASPKFNVPVPLSWQMVKQEGSISGLCFGSGSECGTIVRSYETHESETKILFDLKTAQTNGWTFKLGSNGGLSKASLVNTAEKSSAYVLIEGSQVKIGYTKN